MPTMDPPAGRPYPCQGPSPRCSWWAAVPFGRCPECASVEAVLDLGAALRERRAPWCRAGELRDVAGPRDPDAVPPRAAWAVRT